MLLSVKINIFVHLGQLKVEIKLYASLPFSNEIYGILFFLKLLIYLFMILLSSSTIIAQLQSCDSFTPHMFFTEFL